MAASQASFSMRAGRAEAEHSHCQSIDDRCKSNHVIENRCPCRLVLSVSFAYISDSFLSTCVIAIGKRALTYKLLTAPVTSLPDGVHQVGWRIYAVEEHLYPYPVRPGLLFKPAWIQPSDRRIVVAQLGRRNKDKCLHNVPLKIKSNHLQGWER